MHKSRIAVMLLSVALAGVSLPASASGSTMTSFVIDISGRVVDEAGKPVARASVTIEELSVSTTTASDGTFRFSAIPDGRYTVSAQRAGYATGATAAADARGSSD